MSAPPTPPQQPPRFPEPPRAATVEFEGLVQLFTAAGPGPAHEFRLRIPFFTDAADAAAARRRGCVEPADEVVAETAAQLTGVLMRLLEDVDTAQLHLALDLGVSMVFSGEAALRAEPAEVAAAAGRAESQRYVTIAYRLDPDRADAVRGWSQRLVAEAGKLLVGFAR